MLPSFDPGRPFAEQLDRQDPLARFRDRFYLQPGVIYLDGNSLGLASRDAEASLLLVVADWKEQAVEGWTGGERPWFYLAERLGAMQAELVGASPEEVLVTGTTTTNLHTLAAGFYRPQGRRSKIVALAAEFPSDIYALKSHLQLHGLDPAEHLVLVESADGRTVDEGQLIAALTEDVALLVHSAVLYGSGQLLDVARIAAAARQQEIPMGLDLSHAAGSVPVRLTDWGVDFAYWCSYKYLNGGPGATGALFVHRRHFGRAPGLAGWFGNTKATQFRMALEFDPAATAGAWQISTPTVLSSGPLLGSLELFREAGMANLRAKSLRLTEYLMRLTDHYLAPLGCRVGTPREPDRRGGHVAVEHPEAAAICRALRAHGVVPDFRPPAIIRLAPVPLYNSFAEVWQAVQVFGQIVAAGEHHRYAADPGAVS